MEGENMKLQDIADMRDYLEDRCYCPYEIYDMTGFFYELFYPDTECSVFMSGSRGAIHGVFVIASSQQFGNIKTKERIIYIEITDNKVDSCVRIDNTQNNREQIEKFMNGEIDKMSIDEYKDGYTATELEKVLSQADAICIS